MEFILQNMSPEYVLHFRASRPRSVEELRVIGRELERGMSCLEEYKGSRQLTLKNAVEKDFIYDPKRGRAEFHEVQRKPNPRVRCYKRTASISLEIVRNLAGLGVMTAVNLELRVEIAGVRGRKQRRGREN